MTPVAPSNTPDYVNLVKFLMVPFLDSPESLRVDCEVSSRKRRVLVRLAFEGEDKGRVFGRGGRNIQAVRLVLQAVAQSFGESAHLEVFGGQTVGRSDGMEERPPAAKAPSRRFSKP